VLINVGVTVNETGHFDLRGSLADSGGNRIDSVLFSSRLYGADPMTPGYYNFTLTFNGQALFEYGEPGPYWLTGLELLDTTAQDLLVDSKTNFYQTAAYSLTQFEQPLATVQSASEWTFDADSDHKIDYFYVDLGVYVAQAGDYTVNGRLVNAEGAEAAWGSGSFYASAPGDVPATLVFAGWDIGRSQVDGPYTLTDVTISNLSYGTSVYLENVYTTQPYSFTDFEEGFRYIYLPSVRDGRPPVYLERISGVVTQAGVPVAGTEVFLEYYDNTGWVVIDSVYTNASGVYEFTQNLPVVDPGEYLYVYWGNFEVDPSRLSYWNCFAIDYMAASQLETSCDFDVNNVELTSPAEGAAVNLPYTFNWQLRGVPTDSYEFDLADQSNYYVYWWSPLLGYVDNYTLTSLPSGFMTATPYSWWIWIWGENGYGSSYYSRTVSFNNTGSLVTEGELQPLSPERIRLLMHQRLLDGR
jgi:hypothetical protein